MNEAPRPLWEVQADAVEDNKRHIREAAMKDMRFELNRMGIPVDDHAYWAEKVQTTRESMSNGHE